MLPRSAYLEDKTRSSRSKTTERDMSESRSFKVMSNICLLMKHRVPQKSFCGWNRWLHAVHFLSCIYPFLFDTRVRSTRSLVCLLVDAKGRYPWGDGIWVASRVAVWSFGLFADPPLTCTFWGMRHQSVNLILGDCRLLATCRGVSRLPAIRSTLEAFSNLLEKLQIKCEEHMGDRRSVMPLQPWRDSLTFTMLEAGVGRVWSYTSEHVRTNSTII